MKKTAVEWLEGMFNNSEIPNSSMLFKQAKEMFEEQIKDAYNDGVNDECIGGSKTPEQYYNKTFKQETLTYTETAKKEERIFNSTMMSKQKTFKSE